MQSNFDIWTSLIFLQEIRRSKNAKTTRLIRENILQEIIGMTNRDPNQIYLNGISQQEREPQNY